MIEAIDSYYRHSNANVHRSMHELAAEAERALRGRPRRRSPRFVGARPAEIVFVRNATEAINLVRFTWARENVGAGDVVLITRDGAPLEHRPVAAPVPGARRASSSTCELDGEGRLDLDELDAQLAAGSVKLVARRARLERARHDQPGRRDRRSARTPPARRCWSTARRRCRSCRST